MASIRHPPPEGCRAADWWPDAVAVHTHEETVNPVVEQLNGPGTRKPVHVILEGKIRLQSLPQILRNPLEHLEPFITVHGRRVVKGKGGGSNEVVAYTGKDFRIRSLIHSGSKPGRSVYWPDKSPEIMKSNILAAAIVYPTAGAGVVSFIRYIGRIQRPPMPRIEITSRQ